MLVVFDALVSFCLVEPVVFSQRQEARGSAI
jgi:hypothetical protein